MKMRIMFRMMFWKKSSHALSGYDHFPRSFDTIEQANEYLNKMINFWTSQGGKVYED